MKVAHGYDQLVPFAQEALRAEFARRGLLPPLLARAGSEYCLVTIRRFRDLTEALVAKSMLESAGLLCFLQDENLVRMDWGYANAIGGMRLQVPNDQVATALELLTAPVGGGSADIVDENMDVHCPRCGSSFIASLQAGHGSALVSLFLFSVPLPRGTKVWQCEDCGMRWTDAEARG